ncbi:MAG: hypothetical protein ACFCUQ_07725 [Kiloniellales bacterium]
MTIVVRDKNGGIVSVLAPSAATDRGRLHANDDELAALFEGDEAARQLQEVLIASDLSFIRVLEDLIAVLVDRGVIMLTDLPEAAREKLLERRQARGHLCRLGPIVSDESDDEDCPI